MVDKIKTHKDLDVWKESIELARLVYLMTSKFPKEELYGITQQIRRSAVSISSNIAEGAARNSKKEFIQFLYISMSSSAEVRSHLYVALDQSYIDQTLFDKIYGQSDKVGKMISNLIKYLRGMSKSAK